MLLNNYEKLKDNISSARKKQDKAKLTFYTTFLGDVERASKDPSCKGISDDLIIKVGTQWRKAIESNISIAKEKGLEELSIQMNTEMRLLEELLPKRLTEAETRTVINAFILSSGKRDVGSIMKYMKEFFNGQYDGNLVSEVVRGLQEY